MRELDKKAVIIYLKLTLLATFAFANVIQTSIFSMPFSPEYASLLMTYSLPLAIPYANVVSLIYMFISYFMLS